MLSTGVTGAAPPGGSSSPTSDSAASNVRPPFINPWNARARALMSIAASLSKVNRTSASSFSDSSASTSLARGSISIVLQLPVAFPHLAGRAVLELLRHAHGRDDLLGRLITEHDICLRDLWPNAPRLPIP